MPVEWLAGFRRRDVTNRLPPRRSQHGRPHQGPVTKIVLHTTEGATAGGAFAAYDKRAGRITGGVHPHVTVDPYTRSRYQHVPLTRASYSLKWGDQHGVIQVEIVGFSARTYSPEQVEWLGREVLAPIFAAVPSIPRQRSVTFLGADAGLLAAPYPHGKARLSPAAWNATHGVLGHQHAPYDDHWDPGVSINVDQALFYATQQLIPRTPDLEDGPDMDIITDPEAKRQWATWVHNGTTHVREYANYRGDNVGASRPGIAYIIDEQAAAGKLVKVA